MANIRVNPTAAESSVCPVPQNMAYRGAIGIIDALYTKAIMALLTIPELIGVRIPIHNMNIGQNLSITKQNLC